MTQRQDIEQAIVTLEARRDTLSQAVVETSLAALRQQLITLTGRETSIAALRGERRQVTVMFADISGFTAMSEKLDPEEVRSLINACFARLGAAIDRYGGHIDKFIGDEIMALFGAPLAHENDPERALRAALDMMDRLAAFNQQHAGQLPQPLALHFGINTGLVIAGGIGTSRRQDYSVVGDAVNLAARLEGLSEAGEILVGQDTYRLTAPLFEFEVLKPVKVKGKAQPVRLYRLIRARAIPGGQIRGIEGLAAPLVGRAEELVILQEGLNNVCRGQGGVISVIGDAGIGKSRLIKELGLTSMQSEQARWAEGRALSYGQSAGYLVARRVLSNLLGITPEASSVEAELVLKSEIEQLFPGQDGQIYPYLAQLLGVHLDEEAMQRIKYLEGEARQRRIVEAVQALILARSARSPLILVWEDLHWADPSSLQVLETLLPLTQQCALLLLLVYRRPLPASRIHRFGQRVNDLPGKAQLCLELAPLTAEDSSQLFDHLLDGHALGAGLRHLIITKAEGNPFYIEEVIRSLINQGAIFQPDNGKSWVARPDLDDIKLPNTLQGIIMARVDQLDPDTKRVLQVASVVGRNFPYEILAQVIG